MIGSWLIDRESTHDTLKNIMTIPVSMPKVLGAKLFWVGILTALLGIYSVGVTLITGLTVDLSGLTAEAVEAGADIIMLDNMSPEQMKEAIQIIDGRALTECSGNVTKENIQNMIDVGVDYVSSGALTHSAPIMDISLKNLHAI